MLTQPRDQIVARYKDFKGEYRDIRATSDGRFQRPSLES